MNSTPRDAQAPSHRECLLPSMARTPSVTKVTPAKKITFLKRGDPQFAGVRLAVHQRAFKTFSALMDELSQRMPLSFGVRSVTTPRGLHSLSALEQLEDGGCYLCSDKPPKTPSGPGWPQGRGPAAPRLRDIEGQREVPGTSSSRKSLKTPRRILLVKNTDPRLQQTVVLSHRNMRSLAAFLSKASDLLCFPVKQVYTTSGKKVDSLQALLHSPSVLVCAGHEAFRPPAMENSRRSEAGTLSGLTSRSKNRSWGPKTKPSVIHSRSQSGSRPRLPERPGPSDPLVGPAPDRHPQDTPAQPGPLVAGDDMKKKVRMNDDGSLSVEMKVRFHLVGEDTLLWSRRMGRATALTTASGEDPVLGEVDPLCCVWEGYPWGFSQPGVWGPRPCRVGCGEAFGRGGQPGPKYEIWTNPLHASQGQRVAARKRWGLAQHIRCSGLWDHGAPRRERCSQDSASPASSTGHPEGSEPGSSCCPRIPEDKVDSGSPSAQRGAEWEASRSLGEDPGTCTDGAGLGGPEQGGRLMSRARSEEGASSDSSASTREGSSKWGGRTRGCLGMARAETSQQEATEGSIPGSPALTLSSLRSEDLQAEMPGHGTEHQQARGASVMREPLASGLSGSWDSEGASSTPPTCTSAQQGRRRHKSRASAVSSPSSHGLGRVAPRDSPRQCRYCRGTHGLLDSPATMQVPRPPERQRVCRDGSVPRSSGSSSSSRTQASGDLRPPSSGSLPSQDLLRTSSATVTPAGHSDCASGVSPHNAPSAGWAGEAGSRTCSLAPTPPHTSNCYSKSGAASLEEQAWDTPQPSLPLILQVEQPEQGASGPRQGRSCSQTGTLPAQEAQWGPSLEAHWLCGRYCPTPPRGRPCPERRPSSCASTSSSHRSAARGPGGSQQEEGTHQAELTMSSGPSSGASRRSCVSQVVGSGVLSQEKTARRGGLQGQEETSGMSPGTLPRSSPEAVVREWLDNIPEEPVLMTYEMVDETTGAAGGDLRGPEVDPGDDGALEGLGESADNRQQPLEGVAGQDLEPEGVLLVSGDVGPQSGEGIPQGASPEGVSEAPAEAGMDRGAPASCGVGLRALPGRVSASTQILRALMGSKHDRPSSVPEVSRPMARRLSRSAGALITCLASLQFFDEDSGSPASKVRFKDSPRYQELLRISKDLWPGCDLEQDQLDSGLWELTWSQALLDLGSHVATENFTPTSSSGVDISSGSGGSGESSIPCAMDGTLVPEGTELSLKTSNQRSDSRTSENPGDLEKQQHCCSPDFLNSRACACATKEEEAEGDREEEQMAENTMQEEEAQSEETKEGTEGELQEEAQLEEVEEAEGEGLQEEGAQLEETKEESGELQEEAQLEEVEEAEGERLQEEGAQLEETKEGTEGELQEEAQLVEVEEAEGEGLQEEGAQLEETKESGELQEEAQLVEEAEGEGLQEEGAQLEETKEESGELQEEAQLEEVEEAEGERLQEEGAQLEETKEGTEGELQEEAQLVEVEEAEGEGLQEEGAQLEETQEESGELQEEAQLEEVEEAEGEGLQEEGAQLEETKEETELQEEAQLEEVEEAEGEGLQEEGAQLEETKEETELQEEAQLEEVEEAEGEGLQEDGAQLEETKEETEGELQEEAQLVEVEEEAEGEGLQEDGAQLEETQGTGGGELQEEEAQFEEMKEETEERLQEEAQLEEVKEGPEEGLQEEVLEEGLKEAELPEEGRVCRQELSEASSLDGEGSQEEDPAQEEEVGRASASAEPCPPEGTEEPTEPTSHLSEMDPSASESQSSSQLEPGLEKPPGASWMGQEHTQAPPTQGAAEKSSSVAYRVALDCDPILVSVLLKKTEKAFLAHLASAVAELRARWALQDNDLLDQMAAELQQDVARRLQNSTERELQKLQSRAGRMVLGPPRETLTGELLLQTQQRRHRLWGLRNLSAFSERTLGLEPLSFTLEDEPALSTDLGTQLDAEAEGEEFCPCEACVRKKVSPTSPKDTMGATRGPIKEAFDLRQILQRKKGERTDGEAAEVAPGRTHMDLISTRTVQGAEGRPGLGLGPGPGVDEEEDGEGSQRLDRDKDPKPEEAEGAAVAQEREGKTHNSKTSASSELEEAEQEGEGLGERGEIGSQGSGHEDNLQDEAAAGGDQDPGQSDEAEGIEAPEAKEEAQEAEEEAQPESQGVEAQEAEEEAQPESQGVAAQEAEEEAQPESEGVEAQEAEEEAHPESEGVEAQEAEEEAQPESEGVEAQEAEEEAQPESEDVEAQEAEGEAQPESEGVEAQEAEEEAQPESEDVEAQEAEGEAQPESEDVEAQEAEEEAQPEPEGVEVLEAEGEAQEAEEEAQPESEDVEAQEAEEEAQPESEDVEDQEAEGEAQPKSQGVEAQEAEEEAQPESESVEALEAEGEAQPESEGVEAQEREEETQPESEGVEAQEAEGEAQPESEGIEAPETEGEAQPESEDVEARDAEGEAQRKSEGIEALEVEEEAQEAEEEVQPESEGVEALETEEETQPESKIIEAPEVGGETQKAEREAQPDSEDVEALEAEGESKEAEEEAQPEAEGIEAPESEGEIQEAEGEAQPEAEGVVALEAEGETQEAEEEAKPELEAVEVPEAEGEAQEAEGEAQPESEGVEVPEAEGEAQEAEGEAQPESEGVEAPEAEGEAQPESEGETQGEKKGSPQVSLEDGHAERKTIGMYPGSSTSEQEEVPSGPRTPEQGASKGCDLQDDQALRSLTATEVVGRADGFGQDDLDF
uniref:Retinitis pigmentosa 1-like 1 protein n=1 Tax=Callithrix jacchus TaxID=9483 RepID=A0A8I3WCJ9_CALJA|nr:retinitis pigmentosa 1-like 1 protein isoform X1 [Callithrix jacchus]XP_054099657.1 retinitis pigmentosa 1-like 1 protein isoform X1 [Callithrix jacchus]XP_054099658.1 retinitis pigmentosa 1-like 1 protein isoform X1 [Callithrix jacchus]